MSISDIPLIYGEFYLPPSEVTPILWVGNYLNGAELAMVNPRDFRAVLNVSTEGPYRKAPGIAYLAVPFGDGAGVPPELLTICMDFLMFQYETGKKTLVHCAAGVSRAPATAAAFMHISGQMPFDAALNHIKKRRPIVQPHPDIATSIRKFLKLWPYDGSLGEPYKR
jgi:protein-tyrosine phosphatase